MEKERSLVKEEKLYKDSVELLENINKDLKDHTDLDTINIKMVGVVKDLNNVRIRKITGNIDPDPKHTDSTGP
ncbi:MAG TPA: hypothetical protein VMW32_00765 [Bacteroidales bacterium]|nr:hypothetical protein [Bacteroidales bacterium]